jgi:DNA polymerase (family 10)
MLADALQYLQEMSFRMELMNDSFRCNAYNNAFTSMTNAGTLEGWERLPGIGKSIRSEITQVLTGVVPDRLASLRASGPPASLMELLRVRGIGVRRALALHGQGISDMADLEQALKNHTIADVNLVQAYYNMRVVSERVRLDHAQAVLEPLLAALQVVPGVLAATGTGSYRRGRPDVRDLDAVVVVDSGKAIGNAYEFLSTKCGYTVDKSKDVLGRQTVLQIQVMLASGMTRPLTLNFCSPREAGCVVAYFTGSKAYNQTWRALARSRGMEFDRFYALVQKRPVYFENEQTLFDAIGIPYVEPEFRDRWLDVQTPVHACVTQPEILGDMHIHTKFSDGTASAAEMYAKAVELGYSFIGISDHAGGTGNHVAQDAVSAYAAAVRGVRTSNCHVFAGLEIDVRKDRSLVCDDATGLNYVFISCHADPEHDTLGRYQAALTALRQRHPKLALAVAHPSTRLIGTRAEAPLDWSAFYGMCSVLNAAVEINGQPSRADPDDGDINLGKQLHCKFLLSSDAHSSRQMAPNIGVATRQARRALLRREDVLNTTTTRMKHWLSGHDLRRLR